MIRRWDDSGHLLGWLSMISRPLHASWIDLWLEGSGFYTTGNGLWILQLRTNLVEVAYGPEGRQRST